MTDQVVVTTPAPEHVWQSVRLGELLEVQNGYAFSSKKFSEAEGMPLIRIRDLKNSGRTAVLFSGEFDASYIVNDGDLLIGMDGEFMCHQWAGGEALLNQRVCRLTNFSENLLPSFVLYGINKFLKEIEEKTTYTTVKHLSSKTIKAIDFPLPPLEAQKRIVAVLDQAFAALDRARAHAEANLADAKDLLVLQRETLISGDRKTWAAMTVGDVCERFEYGTSSKSLTEGRVPVLRMGNLQQGELDWSSLVYTDDTSDIKKLSLHADDVLFNRTNSAKHVGKTAIFRGEREAIFAGYLIRLHVRKNVINPEYLNIFLNSNAARNYGRSVMGKSVNQANISASKLRTYPINVPPLAEQEAIAANLLCIREETNKLTTAFQKKLLLIADLRQSLLQKAFSGQLT